MSFPRLVQTLLLVAFLAGSARFSEAQVGRIKSPPDHRLERRGLSLMKDVVPHAPFPLTALKISSQGDRGFWGPLFGDERMAAVVAVAPAARESARTAAPSAQLCLLIWDGRWKFQQQIGQVPAVSDEEEWDWTIKRRKVTEGYYILSHLALYPPADHDSWHCEAATHQVAPTGWRKDAIPSLAGDAITFTSEDQPGYSAQIYTAHHFEGQPEKLIASWQQESREGASAIYLVSRPDPASGKLVTWRFREKPRVPGPAVEWAVSRSESAAGALERREDATVRLSWGRYAAEWQGLHFLIGRLTGLDPKAIAGVWESDWALRPTGPEKATVIGLPEAIELFTWPVASKP